MFGTLWIAMLLLCGYRVGETQVFGPLGVLGLRCVPCKTRATQQGNWHAGGVIVSADGGTLPKTAFSAAQ